MPHNMCSAETVGCSGTDAETDAHPGEPAGEGVPQVQQQEAANQCPTGPHRQPATGAAGV